MMSPARKTLCCCAHARKATTLSLTRQAQRQAKRQAKNKKGNATNDGGNEYISNRWTLLITDFNSATTRNYY
jgi:hypothetical protein